MAGYHNFSKSNNAVEAEANGILPLTAATKEVAVKYKVSQAKAKAWLELNWGGEWHHYSSFYNTVKVYRTDLDEEEICDLQNFQPPNKKAVAVEKGIFKIEYTEFEGTRRHPRAVEKSYEGPAEIKGSFIYFANARKKVDGNHIVITKISDN